MLYHEFFNNLNNSVMSDRLKCAGRLNRLLENNFYVAKCYRKTAESITEKSLRTDFQRKASKRFQFAIELSEEIGFLKGAYSSYGPFSPFRRSPAISRNENLLSLIKKSLKNEKGMLKDYKRAIGDINQGSTREILIRHISVIENNIFHLKRLRSEHKESTLTKVS